MSMYSPERGTDRGAPGTFLDYAVTFAPWAGYIVFTHVLGSWKYGFLVGLALSAAIVVVRTLQRDSRFIDLGTLAYCAVMTGVSVGDPASPLRPYNLPMSLGVVGSLSSVSLALKSPFTYRIARHHVPRALLEDPDRHRLLYRAHVWATSSWAGGQLAAGAASAAMVAAGVGSASVIAVQSVGTLLPVATTRFQHARISRHFGARADKEAPQPVETEHEDLAGKNEEGTPAPGGALPEIARPTETP